MAENLEHPGWGGKREGQGRPRKERKNKSRQISLPPDLDEKLKAMAEAEGVSFSSLVVHLVKIGLEK